MYALSVVVKKVEQYSNYEAFQNDRIANGKTFQDFLKILFETLELTASLTRTGMVEDTTAASSTRTLSKLHKRVKRVNWNDCDDFVVLRLSGDPNEHIPIEIEDFESKSPTAKQKETGERKEKASAQLKILFVFMLQRWIW